jgi:hypothetical protein
MNTPSSWLTAPDPYTGEPWDGVMLGPWEAGVVLQEAYAVPEHLPVLGDDGFVKAWKAVPEKRCIGCGALTRRTILVGVQVLAPVRWTEGRVAVEKAAQCPSCSRGETPRT